MGIRVVSMVSYLFNRKVSLASSWCFGSADKIRFSPGRFHASLVIKLVLVHLVMNYEFRLEDVNAPRLWNWQNFTVPYDKTRVEFRRRSI